MTKRGFWALRFSLDEVSCMDQSEQKQVRRRPLTKVSVSRMTKSLNLGLLITISITAPFMAFAGTTPPPEITPPSAEPAATSTTSPAVTAASPVTVPVAASTSKTSDSAACMENLKITVRAQNLVHLKAFCEHAQKLPTCTSTEGRPIQHADSSSPDARGKRILVFGMIHGDEPLAGEMALEWEERLQSIDHRNTWRVVPMLNPDGLRRKTRMNAHGVDLNRNFPTKDWADNAQLFWKKAAGSDPRRFPGTAAVSEVETRCVISHIKDFKPDFIVSVHTPYKVLDFDGPKMLFPRYRDLPWRALGNFPGSLGRYMWKDYQVPVLTVELGTTMVDAAQLQDIVGSFAIEASRRSGQKTAATFDLL
jgi:protein MpaA